MSAAKSNRKKRTLYVCRPLLNAADVIAWANQAGFRSTLKPEDMHVTLAYSRVPLIWPDFLDDSVALPPDPRRAVKRLGDKGATVLLITAPAFQKRWKEFRIDGASWDYPQYQPHVTLSYDATDINPKSLKAYPGALEFGPERGAPIDDDFSVAEVAAVGG